MSKPPFFLDFSALKLPPVDAWEILALPIRLLGRAALESNPEAQAHHIATKDISDRAEAFPSHTK